MEFNNFYKDAHCIFKDLSKKIAEKSIQNPMDAIHSTLLFALGMEKLLKGILFDINPVFILVDSDFKNAFSVYHLDRLISDNKKTDEINQKPNGDVIAFQSSVMRATLVSQAAHDHKNILMRLKNARDIIVHNSFDKLNTDELKVFLNRDFYVILKAFSDELQWTEIHCFNNQNPQLALIASSIEGDIEKRIKLKIDAAIGKWKVEKKQDLRRKRAKTVGLLNSSEFVFPSTCPCCKNYAVVFTNPIVEYNQFIKKEIQVGQQILKFQCLFCGLMVNDYQELDVLKIASESDLKQVVLDKYEETSTPLNESASKDRPFISNTPDSIIEDIPSTNMNKSSDIDKPDEADETKVKK